MKVALLADHLSHKSGWGRYAVELITRLPDFGIEPVVLAPSQSTSAYDYRPTLRKPGNAFQLPFWVASCVWRSYPEVKECSLIHSLVEHYSPVAALLAGNRPFLCNVYGTYAVSTLKSRAFGPLMRLAVKRAAYVVSISHYTARRLEMLAPEARTCVIRSGVDTSRFSFTPVPYDMQQQMILSVGAVKPRKGYDVILSAFARIANESPNTMWIIAGSLMADRGYAENLQTEVQRLGLTDRVLFKGIVDDEELLQLYKSCYLFILAPRNEGNHFEGYGLVYGEANASGKPIIATRDNGSEETVEEGVNGLLVGQNDIEETERALRWLLAHPKKAVQMGRRGRQKVETLTWTRTVEEFVSYYREITGSTP